jgi:Ca2+ transporting ATPase
VSVTATNNYLKEKQFQKLNALATAKNINVMRGG